MTPDNEEELLNIMRRLDARSYNHLDDEEELLDIMRRLDDRSRVWTKVLSLFELTLLLGFFVLAGTAIILKIQGE